MRHSVLVSAVRPATTNSLPEKGVLEGKALARNSSRCSPAPLEFQKAKSGTWLSMLYDRSTSLRDGGLEGGTAGPNRPPLSWL